MGEFKKFILRGNVIDLAVGIIIGGAFNKIVTSLVNDVIMPLLSIVLGQTKLDSMYIALDGGKYESIEAAGAVPLLKYGSFISTILDFLLMALVIFLLVRTINTLRDKIKRDPEPAAAPAAPATKICPYCITEIKIEARRCPNCTSEFERRTNVSRMRRMKK